METQNNVQRGPTTPSHTPNANVRTPSFLGSGLHIKGEITGEEDLRLDGKVEGLISLGGFRVTVGHGARVEAEIVVREAVISGEVIGEIRAWDRIEIKKDASVVGDLCTRKLMMEEGAFFKGNVETDSKGQPIGTDLNSLLSGASKTGEK